MIGTSYKHKEQWKDNQGPFEPIKVGFGIINRTGTTSKQILAKLTSGTTCTERATRCSSSTIEKTSNSRVKILTCRSPFH